MGNRKDTAFRVAHLDFSVEQSVDRKLESQAETAHRLGLPVDFIVFSPAGRSESRANWRMCRLPGDSLGRTAAPKVQWPFRLAWAAHACDWRAYDAVILRYPKLPVGWTHFLRHTGRPLITEHHTDEVVELRGDGTPWRRMAAALETRMRRGFLRSVAGVIGVTPEITDRVRALAPQAKTATISNGVDVESVPFTGFVPFDGKTLLLVSVASRYTAWHGIERLLDGLDRYRGPVHVELALVGLVPAPLARRIELMNKPEIRIRCTGALYGPEKIERVARANLAVASLALYRKRMEQACALKVREYAAHGIPFVYGYEDPDLPDRCAFALRVANNETPVDVGQWVEFAAQVSAKPGLAGQMRKYATEKMDWSHKIRAMVEFAKEVVAARTPDATDTQRPAPV